MSNPANTLKVWKNTKCISLSLIIIFILFGFDNYIELCHNNYYQYIEQFHHSLNIPHAISLY